MPSIVTTYSMVASDDDWNDTTILKMKGIGKDPAQPKVRLKMDYENFKEQFIEQLQEELYGKGVEARFDTKAVEKLNNEGYDAVTVTPAESNIGVTGYAFFEVENNEKVSVVVEGIWRF